MHQLDVNILIERAGKAIARTWEDAPSATVIRGAGDGAVVRRIAQSKKRQPLQRTIKQNDTRRDASTRGEAHVWESDETPNGGQAEARRNDALRERQDLSVHGTRVIAAQK